MTPIAKYTPPSHQGQAFNCPHCGVYATQAWYNPNALFYNQNFGKSSVWLCRCAHCNTDSIWHEERMMFPSSGTAPLPSPDIPSDIRPDYEEARSIVGLSPRGAAALLRLAIQKLCKELGEPGANINEDIKSLVKKGLPIQVQQALDIVRVVGNNAVHPGQIDLNDRSDTAAKLFGLVNLITEVMITQPKHVAEMFNSLVPASTRQAIAKRDSP
jgi:hypothetical protein